MAGDLGPMDALIVIATALLSVEHRVEALRIEVADFNVVSSGPKGVGRSLSKCGAEAVRSRMAVDQQYAHSTAFG